MATNLHLVVFDNTETEQESEGTEIYLNSRDNIVVIPGRIGLFEITREDWIEVKNFIDNEFSKL